MKTDCQIAFSHNSTTSIGYNGYSDFIASENDFFILRRFASVSAKIALELQDEVVVLEERLEDVDRELSRRGMVDVNNGSFRDDIPERKEVLRVEGEIYDIR